MAMSKRRMKRSKCLITHPPWRALHPAAGRQTHRSSAESSLPDNSRKTRRLHSNLDSFRLIPYLSVVQKELGIPFGGQGRNDPDGVTIASIRVTDTAPRGCDSSSDRGLTTELLL